MREEKEEKGIEVEKEEVKAVLSTDMLLYYTNHKDSIRNLLDLIGTFRKLTNIQKCQKLFYLP